MDQNCEQIQLAKLIDAHIDRYPDPTQGTEQLLANTYDYMNAFKRIMDSSTSVQMDYLCQRYSGLHRFAKLLEFLAQGVADGVSDVPKDNWAHWIREQNEFLSLGCRCVYMPKLKHTDDQPSIGLILCKQKNNLIAEYALRDAGKPIGISEYQLTQALPSSIAGELPTIEELESELSDNIQHV